MENSSDGRKEIPADLVSEILGRLQVTDCIRSGAVCHSWASELGAKQFRPNPNQTPWLMLPGQPEDEETTATFMDLSNNKLYKIRLPDNPPIRSRYCMGSSDGWLVTVDNRAEMILLNPLTGSQIELPSITTLTSILTPNCDSEGNITTYRFVEMWDPKPREPEEFRNVFYVKVVLSSSPIEKDYMIMLIHNPGERLAFARAGDKAWTICPTSTSHEYYLFNDVIYLEGRFYTVRLNGLVQAWDPQNTDGIFSKSTLSIPFFQGANQNYDKYLVMSPWGSLLQVWRLVDYVDCKFRSEEFKVYQLVKTSQKWIEIKNLGDHALFIGCNRSMCVSSRNVPGVRRNCIYFTQNSMEKMILPENMIQTRDVGIYNLEDGSFELFFPYDSAQLNWPPPIWITPNLF